MRANETTALIGDRVVLVPYRHEHVAHYHQWMTRPDLLSATASEPLSLEEEYEMQKKWHVDEDKLTFIVLALPDSTTDDGALEGVSSSASSRLKDWSPEEIKACKMIGDVNLFLPDGPEGDVECEVMIAEDDYRGKGIAKEALSILLNYSTAHLPHPISLPNLLVRISTSNHSSLALFASLGFERIKVVKAFDEVEMRFGRRRRGGGKLEGGGVETEDRLEEIDDGDEADGGFEVLPEQELNELVRDRWRCAGRVVAYPETT